MPMDELFWKSLRTFLKPIAALWEGHQASRLYINSPDDVWIEQNGHLEQTSVQLSQEQLLHTVRHLAQLSGILLNEENPFFSQAFEDGTRITVLLPPWVEEGPVVVLEREDPTYFHLAQMIQSDFLSEPAALFLKAALQSKRSMWLVGSDSTGKSTLLRALAEHLPAAERTLLLANGSPVEIHHPHLIQIRKYLAPSEHHDPQSKRHDPHIPLSQMITKLRPQRLLIEDLDTPTLQNLGTLSLSCFLGSLVTFSATDSTHALSVFEALWSPFLSGASPYTQRLQVATTVSLILTCRRTPENKPQLQAIDEVTAVDLLGNYGLRPLFRRFWAEEKTGAEPRELLLPTGVLPSFWTSLANIHPDLADPSFYHPGNYTFPYFREPSSRLQASEQLPINKPSPRLKDWLSCLEPTTRNLSSFTSHNTTNTTQASSLSENRLALAPQTTRDLHGNKEATDLFAVLGNVLSALSSQHGNHPPKEPTETSNKQAETSEPSYDAHPSNDATLTPKTKPSARLESYDSMHDPTPMRPLDPLSSPPSASLRSIPQAESAASTKRTHAPTPEPRAIKHQPDTQQSLPQSDNLPLQDVDPLVEPALFDVSFDEDQMDSTHLTQLSDADYTHLAPLQEPPAWPQTNPSSPHTFKKEPTPPQHRNRTPHEMLSDSSYEPHRSADEFAEEDLHVARNELLFQPVQPRPNGNTQVTDLPPEKAYALMQSAASVPHHTPPPSVAQPHPSQVYTAPPPSYASAGYGSSVATPFASDAGYLPSPAGQDIVHLMGQPTQLSTSPHASQPVGSIPVKRGQRQSLDDMGLFSLDHAETTAVRSRQQEAQAHRPEATIARFDREPAVESYAMYPSSAALPSISSAALPAAAPPPIPPDAKRTSPPPIPPDAKRTSSPLPRRPLHCAVNPKK